jgi:hypothetical protein
MQAWNQVTVVGGGDHEGRAGVVLRVESSGVMVVLDGDDRPTAFTLAELVIL